MHRKYSAEFEEKAVHQIIEILRLDSCSVLRAYTEVGGLLKYLTTRYAPVTATASPMSRLHQQVAKSWKRSSSFCPGKTAS